MTTCPFCGFENIEGTDQCEQCETPLTDLHLQEPATAVERGLLADRIQVLAPRTPIAVTSDTPVRDVLRQLVDQSIGCILVVDGSVLVGIFSERDALMKLNVDSAKLVDRPVSEFMTKSVETLENNAKIAFAVQRMDLGSFRHIPIVDQDGNPRGIISARDILRYLTERMTMSTTGRRESDQA